MVQSSPPFTNTYGRLMDVNCHRKIQVVVVLAFLISADDDDNRPILICRKGRSFMVTVEMTASLKGYIINMAVVL